MLEEGLILEDLQRQDRPVDRTTVEKLLEVILSDRICQHLQCAVIFGTHPCRALVLRIIVKDVFIAYLHYHSWVKKSRI